MRKLTRNRIRATQFKTGDLVFWMLNPLAKHGTAAEFTVVPEENVCPVPAGVDIFSASALPLVVNTAWQVGDV
jgi:NADPH:quinone reductase-like Zn-dependent oxidoreductase